MQIQRIFLSSEIIEELPVFMTFKNHNKKKIWEECFNRVYLGVEEAPRHEGRENEQVKQEKRGK